MLKRGSWSLRKQSASILLTIFSSCRQLCIALYDIEGLLTRIWVSLQYIVHTLRRCDVTAEEMLNATNNDVWLCIVTGISSMEKSISFVFCSIGICALACLCFCYSPLITRVTERLIVNRFLLPNWNYTVSTKKIVTLYICCHKSGKQRRILTKFYANTVTLNGKQVTKFQQN